MLAHGCDSFSICYTVYGGARILEGDKVRAMENQSGLQSFARCPLQRVSVKRVFTSLVPRPRPAFHRVRARGEPVNEAKVSLCILL